jgi:hypothetical protein
MMTVQALVSVSDAFSNPRSYFSKLRRPDQSTTSLRVSHFSSAALSQPTYMVSGGSFEESSLFDDLNNDAYDEDDDSKLQSLSYLPVDLSTVPPLTLELLQNATENHVFGRTIHPMHVWDVISSEYQSFDVPVRIEDQVIDVRKTGEQLDESLAELLSLAALYRLPKEIVVQLVGSAAVSAKLYNATSPFDVCLEAFSTQGWSTVSFPQGLALRPKLRKYRRRSSSQRSSLLWYRNPKRRVEHAEAAVAEAQSTIAPPRRISREELLAKIQLQLGELSESDVVKYESTDRLYFPDSMPTLPFSWKRIKRTIDKQYAKLKSKGKVGILAYCFFNFAFYTIGMLWQWPRVAPAHPLSASTVSVVVFRKFCRVFGSLYISSQFFKLPKLVAAVAMLPVSSKCLSETRERLRISESLSMVVLVSIMVALWSGIVSIPIISEYTRLRRFAQLERLLSIHEVVPAFYFMRPLALLEC